MQTIKQINKQLKKINKAIQKEKPNIDPETGESKLLNNLNALKSKIQKDLTAKTDPKNAKRCALPLKVQRKLGLKEKIV